MPGTVSALADDHPALAAAHCEFLDAGALPDWIERHCLHGSAGAVDEAAKLVASVRNAVGSGHVWRGEFMRRHQARERVLAVRIAAAPGAMFMVLTEDVTRSRHEMRLCRLRGRILARIADSEPVHDVLMDLIREAQAMVPQLVCALRMLAPEGEHFNQVVAPDLPPAFREALAHAPARAACGIVAFTGETLVVPEIARHAGWRDLHEAAAQACVAVPIRLGGRLAGVLSLYWLAAYPVGCDEVQFANQLVVLVVKAMENARRLRGLIRGAGTGPGSRMFVDAMLEDLARREDAARFERMRTTVLGMIAENRPRLETLGALASGLEEVLPGTLCSLRVFAPEGAGYVEQVAPSLPVFYCEAVGRVAMEASDSNIVTRARQGERLIATDLQAQPDWAPLAPAASNAGLRACWVEPVRAANSEVIGTLALYHRAPYQPSAFDLKVSDESARLAGVAIEQSRTLANLAVREAHLRTLVRTIPYLVWLKNDKGAYLACNPLFEDFYGQPEAALLNRTDFDFLPRGDAEDFRASDQKAMQTHQPVVNESWLSFARSGRRGLFETMKVPMLDAAGEVVGVLGIARDVTGQRRLQNELEQARDDAEAAARVKSEFLANMSHEIRTPMSAIMGLLDLALRTPLNDQQHDYLDKAQGAARALMVLLNDVLDLSKIDAGQLAIEAVPFELEAVFESLGDLLELSVERKGLELIFYLDPLIPERLVGDPLRLSQVLTNLASNAVKFTERGEIEITATALALDQDNVRLRFVVRDTGIGMDATQQQRLFLPFSQGDSSVTRRFGGTGLGLAISKQIVDLMQGEIEVESVPGMGSAFSFELPFKVATNQRRSRPAVPGELRGMKALVLESNQSLGAVLSAMLGQLAIPVVIAETAEAGVALVHADPAIACVLMDARLPVPDPAALARELRAAAADRGLRIVLITTGAVAYEAASSGDASAFDRILRKPVKAARLLDTLLQCFGLPLASRTGTRRDDSALDLAALAPLRGVHLLLVEDNDINRQVATEVLGSAGITVRTASNGREALAALAAETFDGVLMDIQMPVMDGYTATRHIRAQAHLAKLPILAMSANVMADDYTQALEAGMDALISKPVEPRVLFANLLKWIKSGAAPVAPEAPGEALPEAAADAPAPDAGLPPIEGLDQAVGMARVGGNPVLYRKLLGDFITDHRADIERMSLLVAQGEQAVAGRIAHTLKGVLGTLGAMDCATRAAALDMQLRGEDRAAQDQALADFAPAFNALVSAIASAIPQQRARGSGAVAPDPALLLPQLERLAKLLAERDPEAAEQVVALLDLLPARGGQVGEGLEHQCQRFDFRAARASLRALRTALELELGIVLPAGS